MGLSESFRDSVKSNLGSAGIIFPPTSVANLGDYGFYNQGVFSVVDNIFKRTGTNVNDFINDKIDESPAFNYLLHNKEATSIATQIKGDVNEVIGVEIAYSFNSQSGFVAQLSNTRTGSIFLNDELKKLLQSLKDNELWKNSYRFVWQIWETELKFAFAQSTTSTAVLSAALDKAVIKHADLNLEFNFMKSSGTSGNLWAKDGVVATPIANFAKYNMFGTVKPQYKNALFENNAQPFVEDTIIPDNSWSNNFNL